MLLQTINLSKIQKREGHSTTFLINYFFMKSLIKKKEEPKKVEVAQCCAKTSRTVVGCHD